MEGYPRHKKYGRGVTLQQTCACQQASVISQNEGDATIMSRQYSCVRKFVRSSNESTPTFSTPVSAVRSSYPPQQNSPQVMRTVVCDEEGQ